MKFRQPNTKYASRRLDNTPSEGAVAQVVERSLSMREVRGSIPRCSKVSLLPSLFLSSLRGAPSLLTAPDTRRPGRSSRAPPLASQ